MAKFNNTNLKKLIKNYHVVSAQLDNSEYTSVKGDRAALEAKFGFQGAEYLTQLDEYINELNAPLAKSSRSIAKVIEKQIYSQFTEEELADFDKVLASDKIDWDALKSVCEKKYGDDGYHDVVSRIAMDVYKEDSSRINALFGKTFQNATIYNLNNDIEELNNDIENLRTDYQEVSAERDAALNKAKRNKNIAIIAGAAGAAAALGVLIPFLISNNAKNAEISRLNDELQNANANSAIVEYYNVEQEQLKEFESMLNTYKEGGLTEEEQKELKNKIIAYSMLDNAAYGYASTNQMESLLENAILEEKNQTLAELTQQVQDLTAKIAELEEFILNVPESEAELVAQLMQAKKDLEDANKKIAELETANDTLKKTNSALAAEISGLNNTISSLNNEINTLNGTISALVSANADLTTENATLTELCADYANQVKEVNNRYDALNAQYNSKVAEYNNLAAQYDDLYAQYEKALADNNQAEVNRLTKELNELNETLTQKETELANAYAALEEMNATIDELEAQISALSQQLSVSNPDFVRALYTKLTGKSAEGKTDNEIVAYLSDAFDISISQGNSGALEDEGSAPQK